VNPTLLDETWNVLSSILPTCLTEIQRAVAEVWAGVLRRLKAGPREKAVLLLATSVDLEDATAWIIVFSCKVFVPFFICYNQLIPLQSVSQTLHTCTPSIFTILLNYFLSNPAYPKSTQTLIRRSLTALIHHVGNADQFSILSETILQQVLSIFRQSNYDAERLKRALNVSSILLGVRQGSRLTGRQPYWIGFLLTQLTF
jgi:U3 small nucleolar RNA-associated protein 20